MRNKSIGNTISKMNDFFMTVLFLNVASVTGHNISVTGGTEVNQLIEAIYLEEKLLFCQSAEFLKTSQWCKNLQGSIKRFPSPVNLADNEDHNKPRTQSKRIQEHIAPETSTDYIEQRTMSKRIQEDIVPEISAENRGGRIAHSKASVGGGWGHTSPGPSPNNRQIVPRAHAWNRRGYIESRTRSRNENVYRGNPNIDRWEPKAHEVPEQSRGGALPKRRLALGNPVESRRISNRARAIEKSKNDHPVSGNFQSSREEYIAPGTSGELLKVLKGLQGLIKEAKFRYPSSQEYIKGGGKISSETPTHSRGGYKQPRTFTENPAKSRELPRTRENVAWHKGTVANVGSPVRRNYDYMQQRTVLSNRGLSSNQEIPTLIGWDETVQRTPTRNRDLPRVQGTLPTHRWDSSGQGTPANSRETTTEWSIFPSFPSFPLNIPDKHIAPKTSLEKPVASVNSGIGVWRAESQNPPGITPKVDIITPRSTLRRRGELPSRKRVGPQSEDTSSGVSEGLITPGTFAWTKWGPFDTGFQEDFISTLTPPTTTQKPIFLGTSRQSTRGSSNPTRSRWIPQAPGTSARSQAGYNYQRSYPRSRTRHTTKGTPIRNRQSHVAQETDSRIHGTSNTHASSGDLYKLSKRLLDITEKLDDVVHHFKQLQ